MPHWRNGKLAPEEPAGGGDDLVRVVEKLPKIPPSQILLQAHLAGALKSGIIFSQAAKDSAGSRANWGRLGISYLLSPY